jgi:predicted transcriptional regulator
VKLQQIKIQIKSLDNVLDDFTEVAENIKAGEEVAPKKGTYIADVETALSILTESRMKIIQLLKSKEPQSIYALAKLLNRDFKNVYDDITFLNQLGIIGIEESTTGLKRKKPILLCDKILFEMVS